MKMAGIYNNHTAIWLSALVAGVNVLFTFVGMLLVDRIGRRKLILASFFGKYIYLKPGTGEWKYLCSDYLTQ